MKTLPVKVPDAKTANCRNLNNINPKNTKKSTIDENTNAKITCDFDDERCRIDDFRGACAVKGNGAVAGHVKRVDHDDVFDALLFREETLTRHYFI